MDLETYAILKALNKKYSNQVKVMTEKEIEISMNKALKKLPFELKKIKFFLAIIKFFKRK